MDEIFGSTSNDRLFSLNSEEEEKEDDDDYQLEKNDISNHEESNPVNEQVDKNNAEGESVDLGSQPGMLFPGIDDLIFISFFFLPKLPL